MTLKMELNPKLIFWQIVNDPILSANELNHDLHLIERWAYQWKMSFNPDPSKKAVEILFTQKGIVLIIHHCFLIIK